MSGMKLGIASFVLLIVAAILMFWHVWLGVAAFVASVIVQTLARKRFTREELPMRRRL